MTRHLCRCAFVPPHVLNQLAQSIDPDLRATARASSIESSALRRGRRERTSPESVARLAEVTPQPLGPGAAPAIPSPGGKRHVFDSKNTTEQHKPPAVREEGDPATGDDAVNDAYDAAGVVRDYLADELGRNSIDNNGLDLVLNVHYGTNYQNAFWDGDEMTFGDGDGQIFISFAKSLDVVAHELAHGVTQHTCGLDYDGQSGALNEHFSDVWGSVITQFHNGEDAGSADWLIGDEIMGPPLLGEALRSMSHPGTAYDNQLLGKDPQPAHMSGYYAGASDNHGVHINSGIPNRAFFLVASDIGTDVAAKVWYHGQQSLWPAAKFNDAVGVLVESARTLTLSGAIRKGAVQAVRAAFAEVGLPS